MGNEDDKSKLAAQKRIREADWKGKNRTLFLPTRLGTIPINIRFTFVNINLDKRIATAQAS